MSAYHFQTLISVFVVLGSVANSISQGTNTQFSSNLKQSASAAAMANAAANRGSGLGPPQPSLQQIQPSLLQPQLSLPQAPLFQQPQQQHETDLYHEFEELTSDPGATVGNHLRILKFVLHDVIALIANTLSLITASLNFGNSNPAADIANIKRNLASFQESYYNLTLVVTNDLSKTAAILQKIPGFGLIRFVLHLPIVMIDNVRIFLYKILVALGLSY